MQIDKKTIEALERMIKKEYPYFEGYWKLFISLPNGQCYLYLLDSRHNLVYHRPINLHDLIVSDILNLQ